MEGTEYLPHIFIGRVIEDDVFPEGVPKVLAISRGVRVPAVEIGAQHQC